MNDQQQRYNRTTQKNIQMTAAEESVADEKNDNFKWNQNDLDDNILLHRRPEKQQTKVSKKLSSRLSARAATNNADVKKSIENNNNINNNNSKVIMFFSTPDERIFVKTAKTMDILIGRGKPYQIHPGNQYMRKLVAENYDLYNNSPRDLRKAVALNLLERLTKSGIRFLQRCMEPPQNALFLDANNYDKKEKDENHDKNSNKNISNLNIKKWKEYKENQNTKNDNRNIEFTSTTISVLGDGKRSRNAGGCWELASKDEACEKLCHALRFKPRPPSSSSNSKLKTPPKSLLATRQQHQRLTPVNDQIEMVDIHDDNNNNNNNNNNKSTSAHAAAVSTPQPAVCITATDLMRSHCPDQLDSNALLRDNNTRPSSLPPSTRSHEMMSILQDLIDQQSRLSGSNPYSALGQESGLVLLLRDRMPNLSNGGPDDSSTIHGNQHYHSVVNSAVSAGASRRDANSSGLGAVIDQLLLFSQERNQHVATLNDLARYALSRHEHIGSNYQTQQNESSLDTLQSTIRQTILNYLVSLLGGNDRNV